MPSFINRFLIGRSTAWAIALAFASAIAAGCSGGSSVCENGCSGLIAATEFVVGENRFPFGVVTRDGDFLEGAAVRVEFSRVEDGASVRYAEANATWITIPDDTVHVHEDGDEHLHLDFRGIYVVDSVDLPLPGNWWAQFVALVDGKSVTVEQAAFAVRDTPGAPGVGQPVPRTENPTIHEVGSFAELSTRQVDSDDLHNVSVAQALDAGEPFVVVFASPRFCVSAMCGPVTEVLEDAREELGGAVEFIHIEPWDLDAARNQGRLVPASELLEWSLPTEPWTFVVGRDGLVAARFEGLVTQTEIVAAVEALY